MFIPVDALVVVEDPYIVRTSAPHQERALSSLSRWWRSKSDADRHGFLFMPTGSGKTFTAVRFAVREVLRKATPGVLWVAHNHYLLAQAEKEFAKALSEAGMDDAVDVAQVRGDGRGADAHVMLATVQMLERGDGLTRIFDEGAIHVAVFDEFHHMTADSWQRVVQRIKKQNVRVLGLSATPFRIRSEDHKRLRRMFPSRIFGVGMSELIRSEFLARPVIRRVRIAGRQRIHLSDDERARYAQFHQLPASVLDRIATQVGRDEIITAQYTHNRAHYGKTIIFCCNVDHATTLARSLRKHGVSAESICGSAKDAVNKATLDRFREGDLEVATSVVLLTEGVDVPACRTVFLARPTESPILLQQMMGRAMRGPKSGGDATCNIVDFVDNFEQGLDFSAGMIGFVRDFEPPVRKRLMRRPRPDSHGIDIALLLRVREYINRRIAESGGLDASAIWEEEIVGWIERWDGELQRVLLIPVGDGGHAILGAAEEVRAASNRDVPHSEDEAFEVARRVYHERELYHHNVPEEDFVATVAPRPRFQGATTQGDTGPQFYDRRDLKFSEAARQGALGAIGDVEREVAAADAPELQQDLAQVIAAVRGALARPVSAKKFCTKCNAQVIGGYFCSACGGPVA